MSSLEIMKANLDLQGRADRVARQEPEALRRDALRAARDMDAEGLWAIVEAFLVTRSARGARVSRYTLINYRAGLSALLAWAGPAGMGLLQPRSNDGFTYVRYLEAKGYAPSTVQVRLSAARALFAALRWAGATNAAPFTDVRAAPDPVPRHEKRKPYSNEDVQKLLSVADEQLTVIVLLGADCGLRVSEMCSLARLDVHFGKEPYIVVTGKRSKRQEVGLSKRTSAALSHWMGMTPSYGPQVLTLRSSHGVEQSLLGLCQRADVRYDGRQVHGLRHTAGTRTYQETSDILAVRDTLRHRSIESSEIYIDYARQGKKKPNSDW